MDYIFDQFNGSNKDYSTNLTTASIRLNFIKKVYSIISCQLLLTTLFCYFSVTSTAFLNFQIGHTMFFNTSITLSVAIPIILMCCKSVSHQVPTNYILLTLFTLSEAYVVSFTCGIVNDPNLVLQAAFLTLGVTFSLTVYAMTTKKDFTIYGFLQVMMLAGTSILGLVYLFTNSSFIHLLYIFCGILIYGTYLVYDTQLIIGGKRCEIGIDDYILGSVLIYTDIIVLFYKILRFLQKLKDDDDQNQKNRSSRRN